MLDAAIGYLTDGTWRAMVARGEPYARRATMAMRYFGLAGYPETLRSIGKEYGVGPERVRQIVVCALRNAYGVRRHNNTMRLAGMAKRQVASDRYRISRRVIVESTPRSVWAEVESEVA